MNHATNCLGFICTCPKELPEDTTHYEDCICRECREEREALKDREFDEKVALGYGV